MKDSSINRLKIGNRVFHRLIGNQPFLFITTQSLKLYQGKVLWWSQTINIFTTF